MSATRMWPRTSGRTGSWCRTTVAASSMALHPRRERSRRSPRRAAIGSRGWPAAGGGEGFWVTTQGGRQLDAPPSTARALPPIAAAVGDRLTVLADGGVRSGLDVVRMLALGAKGVLLGRGHNQKSGAWLFRCW